jgi:hypothetical protein
VSLDLLVALSRDTAPLTPPVRSVLHGKRVHRARGCADGAFVDTKCTSGCGAHSVYGKFDMCCTTECCAAPTPRGHGMCPEFSPGQFPQVGGIKNCTDVVQFHFVWQAETMDAEVQLWMEGLRLTADYINGKGGLRVGEGKVGYVNMTFTEYHPDPKAAGRDGTAQIESYYAALCGQKDVDVLILPLPRTAAKSVIDRLTEDRTCKKPVLAGTDADEIFETDYESVWSPFQKSSVSAAEQAEFLYGLGSRKFVVVGDHTSERAWQSVKDAIEDHPDTHVEFSCMEDRREGWLTCFKGMMATAQTGFATWAARVSSLR